jgi:hypothetical protein
MEKVINLGPLKMERTLIIGDEWVRLPVK